MSSSARQVFALGRAKQGYRVMNRHSALVAAAAVCYSLCVPIVSRGEEEQLQATQAINVLELIDLSADVGSGHWSFQAEGLEVTGEHARIRLPVDPVREYRLHAVVERLRQTDQSHPFFAIGLVVGEYRGLLMLNAQGKTSALSELDGKPWFENETTVAGGVLKPRVPATILCEVRQGLVRVFFNGEPLIRYEGDESKLSLHSSWQRAETKNFFIWTNDEFRIHKLVYQPNLQKLKVPPPDKQKAKLLEIQQLFRDEVSHKSTQQQKLVAARKLAIQAANTTGDAAGKFALYRYACDLAVEAAAPPALLEIATEMCREFELNELALQTSLLERIAGQRVPPDARPGIVQAAVQATEDAIARDEFAAAAKLIKIAGASASKARNKTLVAAVNEAKAKLAAAEEGTRAAAKARQILEKDANDAAANLALGRFLVFVKQRWDEGLPYLRKSGAEPYETLAGLEAAPPQNAEAIVELADAWWEFSQNANAQERAAGLSRALHWYSKAAQQLTGLEKLRVEKRLQQLQKSEPLEKKSKASSHKS